MGGLQPDAARNADAQFDALVRDSFSVLLPTSDDFARARIYLGNYATGLRAGDALHLAIAGTHGAEVIYSLDSALRRAGRLLGLPVSAGIRAGS